MAMLEMFREYRGQEILVAHFNHGTRPSADLDETLVRRKAHQYGMQAVFGHKTLGAEVSEATARQARYDFLLSLGGEVYVAQHLDDLVESVAINLLRGTGWRGLGVMRRSGVRRPFLETQLLPQVVQAQSSKWLIDQPASTHHTNPNEAHRNRTTMFDRQALCRFCAEMGVEWREDPTNNDSKYLRNRLRGAVRGLELAVKNQIGNLAIRQWQITEELTDILLASCPKDGIWHRNWFLDLPDAVSIEWLRVATGLTETEVRRFLQAILHFEAGKCVNLPGDRMVRMEKKYFLL